MISVKKLLYKMLDRPMIIEQGVGGSDGLWTYRKWSDGTAECWARIEKTLTGASAVAPWSGNTYNMGTSNFPTGLFLTAPSTTITGTVGTAYCVVSYAASYYNGVSIYLTTNSSLSGSQSCSASIHAIGKWK